MSEENQKKQQQEPDRRKEDRRKLYIDPADLPFPDRREGDRRVVSEEERAEILKRIKEVDLTD